MAAVERIELSTKDMDLVSDLVRQNYVGHAATFRCTDPARANGRVSTAAAGGLMTGWLGHDGFEYTARMDPIPAPTTATVLQGAGLITTRREERRFAAGDVIMIPLDQHSLATMTDTRCVTLQVPLAETQSLAEEHFGLPAEYLRFESIAPVSAALRDTYARTAMFIYDQLVTSGITRMDWLLLQTMTRMAAAAFLETFPNTTMRLPYLPGPGWVAPAAVRRAAEFIQAQADQPATLPQVAAAAGVTPRVLQDAFRRHYDVTPVQYQRLVRLERAHVELRDAAPGDGVTVTGVARRWGWASPAQFTAAYERRFGALPGHTLVLA